MEKKHLPERIDAKRLYLQKHDLATAETMFKYVDQDRERLARFLPRVDFTKTVEDEIKYIKLSHENWAGFARYDYSIFRKQDGV